MNTKETKRMKKLVTIVNTFNNELWELQRKKRIEDAQALAGRYFKDYRDVSDGYYPVYMRVDSADEFGNLSGLQFYINEHGVHIETCTKHETYYDEIDKEQFDMAWEYALSKITDMVDNKDYSNLNW
jgi:hypothetical protein